MIVQQSTWTSPGTYLESNQKEGIAMDEKMDVFARATLFLYQKRLESLGLEGDLRVVRVGEEEEKPKEDAQYTKVC